MHYYQFHIGDYASHTRHLSLIEDLAYRRLLDFYYLHEQPIKQREIARQIGMKDNEQDVLTVLEEFFICTDDGYINPRADKQIKIFTEHQATSAYGAFIRDNPHLKSIVSKTVFIEHFLLGNHQEYISSLSTHNVDMMGTSSPLDATINHKPITINQEPTYKEGKPSLSGSAFPTCPHQELLKLYGKHLPNLVQPRSWEGARQTNMKQRWIQAGKPSAYSPEGYASVEAGLKWWDSFFAYIANDTSLAKGYENKGRTWLPDLEWIVNRTNFQKIIDGKYAK